jgi:plasmid stabilization system protein ParE
LVNQVRFHPEARHDIVEIASWYAEADLSVATRFMQRLEARLQTIVTFPESSPLLDSSRSVRRARLITFPISIFYVVGKDWIEIIAVLHEKRIPGTWRERL